MESKIGKPVKYKPPRDMGRRKKKAKTGIIIDELWTDPKIDKRRIHTAQCRQRRTPIGCWGDYAFCAQLIRWDHGEHSIRLAYYRRRCTEDNWEYASQMTVDALWPTIKKLANKTLKKKEWFRDNPRDLKLPFRPLA